MLPIRAYQMNNRLVCEKANGTTLTIGQGLLQRFQLFFRTSARQKVAMLRLANSEAKQLKGNIH